MVNCFTRDILNNFGGLEDNSLLTALNVDDETTDEMNVIRHSPYYSLEDFIEHINVLDMGFTALSLNIQSINAKFNNLTIFLNTINSQNTIIYVICIQETWLNEDEDMCSFQMSNYYCISQSKTMQLPCRPNYLFT